MFMFELVTDASILLPKTLTLFVLRSPILVFIECPIRLPDLYQISRHAPDSTSKFRCWFVWCYSRYSSEASESTTGCRLITMGETPSHTETGNVNRFLGKRIHAEARLKGKKAVMSILQGHGRGIDVLRATFLSLFCIIRTNIAISNLQRWERVYFNTREHFQFNHLTEMF